MKKLLLILLTVVMSVSAWADNIASGTFDGKNETYTSGWSTTGTGKQRNDCIIIAGEESITSPSIDFSLYSTITISIKARRYGTVPKVNGTSTAILTVKANGVTIGTANATSTTATTSLTDINYTVTSSSLASFSGPIVVTCSNVSGTGSSGNGAGVNTITVTGTRVGGSSVTSADNLQIPYTETSETFSVTWTNMDSKDVYLFDDAECNTTFSGDWFTAEMASNGDDVDYVAEENTTGADRVVYMQLYGLDSEANEYTKVVTVTQKHLVMDSATLPLDIAAGKTTDELKEVSGITGSWDGSDYNNSTHKIKFSKNTHYMQIKTNAAIGISKYSVLGAAGAGTASFKIQSSADGEVWTDVQSFSVYFGAKDEVATVYCNAAINSTHRYLKFLCTKKTGEVNFGLGAFTIYAAGTELKENVSVSTLGTFCSAAPLDFTGSTAKAYIASEVDASKVTLTQVNKVPAETPVVIMADEAGNVELPIYVGAGANVESNKFKGSSHAKHTVVAESIVYAYSKTNEAFCQVNEGIVIPAGKAYLMMEPGFVPSLARTLSISFDNNEVTGIQSVQQNAQNSVVYNLAGQRVAADTKGIVIMNGKKYLNK